MQSQETSELLYEAQLNLHQAIEQSKEVALMTLPLCKITYANGAVAVMDEATGAKITVEIRAELAIEGPFALQTPSAA